MTLPDLHPVAARPAPPGCVAIRAGGGVVIQHRRLSLATTPAGHRLRTGRT